ncbi:unnamed protein product [Meganyctiphanes norvegica]|uniref:Methyltransferase FkbM domain-containing protein n=1 Tax=Meganyctiphanes norvegica TaxID=48144 RepID=A0AAV2R7J1_MEGNR
MCALVTNIKLQNLYSGERSDLRPRLLGPLSADDPDMLNILCERYLLPPDPRPYNIISNNALYNYHNRQYGGTITKRIQETFSHINKGFFVEAGALDGVYLSNTLWLEQKLGWTGLLVEPNIFSYKELLTKHRKAWVSNTCLSSTKYPRQTVMASLFPEAWFEYQMNIKGSSHELGVQNLENNNSVYFFNSATEQFTNVQCFPLASYLLALNVSTVDFLSLDIQGSEKAVLDTLPWDSVNFRALLVEPSKEMIKQGILDIMTKRGYKYKDFTDNDILFIKKGDPLLDFKSS